MRDALSEWGGLISFLVAIFFIVIILRYSRITTYPVYPSSEDDLYYWGFYETDKIPSEENEKKKMY